MNAQHLVGTYNDMRARFEGRLTGEQAGARQKVITVTATIAGLQGDIQVEALEAGQGEAVIITDAASSVVIAPASAVRIRMELRDPPAGHRATGTPVTRK